MEIFYSDHFVLPLPPGHRFPMSKYARLRERVLAGEFGSRCRVPEAVAPADLERVHDPAYVRRVLSGSLSRAEQQAIGFPWSEAMVERSRRSAGATLAACRSALRHGTAANLAGGTHHAGPAGGAGFCVFNDAATAARTLQAEGAVRRVLVLDCDVHQGNGTAAIFRDDPSVFTLSIHGANNYPFRKEASDLDVALADGAGDAEYLPALRAALSAALGRFDPDLVIYLAGADPYAGDRLGRLQVSMQGLLLRDQTVIGGCAARGLPVAVTMAGGYAADIEETVEIHYRTIETAAWHGRG